MDLQIPNYPLSLWERVRVRVYKPSIQKCWNTRLFDVAKEQMDTPAENTLFLDDWAPYVQVAINSGFQGAVVARDADTSKVEGLTYMRNLNEVEELVINRAVPHPG